MQVMLIGCKAQSPQSCWFTFQSGDSWPLGNATAVILKLNISAANSLIPANWTLSVTSSNLIGFLSAWSLSSASFSDHTFR